jgi:hypothetical protein
MTHFTDYVTTSYQQLALCSIEWGKVMILTDNWDGYATKIFSPFKILSRYVAGETEPDRNRDLNFAPPE